LQNYGISCSTLNNASVTTIKSTDYNRKLLSLGRIPYGKTGERAVQIGSTTYYERYLWAWDSGAYSSYQALQGTRSDGTPFMVLFNCGNVTIVEKTAVATPAAAPKKPIVEIVNKTTLPGTPAEGQTVRPGDLLGYRIYFRNRGDAAATNVFVEDSTPRQTSFIAGSQGSGSADRYSYLDTVYPGHSQEPHVYWAYYNFPAGATGYYVDFKVRVNTGVNNGEQICNTAFIRSNETAQTSSNKICHTIQVNAPTPTPTTTFTAPTPTVVTPTKPCAASTSVIDTASCLEKHKFARNDTQNIANADQTTAHAGDAITYTLTTKNNATTNASYAIEENLADVMEYADAVTNLDGGTLGTDKIVRWPTVTIAPGQVITHTLTVKLKASIPETPTPSSNPGSYDLLLTNVYGDTINIKLPGSVAKIVARANTTLPNTGPGSTVTIAVVVTMFAAYFFARSRLMAKELDIVREEYATSGGY
jgi:uncharacterized repeat protein (TIGR01451 family)